MEWMKQLPKPGFTILFVVLAIVTLRLQSLDREVRRHEQEIERHMRDSQMAMSRIRGLSEEVEELERQLGRKMEQIEAQQLELALAHQVERLSNSKPNKQAAE